MKRILLVLFTLISLNAFSQLQVKEGSFKYVPGGVIDNKAEYTDGNDLPMALIKISTENISEQERMRLVFVGNKPTQIIKKPKVGQMWIYISADAATFIDIEHPDYGTYKYYLPEELCDYCVYEMVLQYVNDQPELGFLAISSEPSEADIYIDGKHYGKTNNVITDLAVGTHELKLEKEGYATLTKTFVTTKGETLKLNETLQAVSKQKVHFIVKADQENATIYIDDEPLGTKEASKLFMLGSSHTWMIKCNMYHTESGTVTLNERTVIDKKLRPNFGFLNISTTPEQGAKVFVDEEYVGQSPVKTDKLKSGTYTVRVMKDMYKMKEQSFTVTDGQTTNATLNMAANFVNVTVNTDSQSYIYVDDEYKGKGRWIGRLSDGTHMFEARKTNHRTSKKSLDLVLGETKTISIDAPSPINGELEINSTPMGATIYIDGKHYGETPNYISDILIGKHELKLTKQGCVSVTKTITIKEGETLSVNEKLQTGKEISISTDQSGDKIYVDGNYLGISPIATYLSYGNHEIKATRGTQTAVKTVEVKTTTVRDEFVLAFGKMIKITSDKVGDDIYVDGNKVGKTPMDIDFTLGKHEVEVRRGKLYEIKNVQVGKGMPSSFYFMLEKESLDTYLNGGVNFFIVNAAYSIHGNYFLYDFGTGSIEAGLKNNTSWGFSFGSVKNAGWFVSAMGNWWADNDNYIVINHARVSLTGGAVAKIGRMVYFKVGTGCDVGILRIMYSGSLKDTFTNTKIAFLTGLQFNLKNTTFDFDIVTSNFKTIEAKMGIGLNWEKRSK